MAFTDLPRIEWRIGAESDLPELPPSNQAGLWAITKNGSDFHYTLYIATENATWEALIPDRATGGFSQGFTIGYDQGELNKSEVVIGSILLFAGTSAPNGYLICNGATVSRADYSDLLNFALTQGNIGAGLLFGDGDGSTTFDLPDLSASSPSNTLYIIKV